METRSTRSKWTLLLVAIVAFVFGGGSVVAYMAVRNHGSRPDPWRAKALADITVIHMALDEFAMNNAGHYPASLDLLVAPDTNGNRYLNQTRMPRDPWDREYCYVPGPPPNVATFGADGKPGGRGSDADIDSASIVNGR